MTPTLDASALPNTHTLVAEYLNPNVDLQIVALKWLRREVTHYPLAHALGMFPFPAHHYSITTTITRILNLTIYNVTAIVETFWR